MVLLSYALIRNVQVEAMFCNKRPERVLFKVVHSAGDGQQGSEEV